MRFWDCLKYLFNCTRYAGKWNGSFEECFDRDFIRRIQRDGVRSAPFRSLVGQPEAWEALEVRRAEVQLAQRRHIEGQIRSTRSG